MNPAETTAETIRRNLLQLLEEPSFKSSAERLRDEILAMAGPRDAIPDIEELTFKHWA